MSSRTFCDRCGRECVAGMRRSVLHMTELQFATGHPEHPVAEDSYRPADLCDICTYLIKGALGDALKIGHHAETGPDSEMAMAMDAPPIPGWDAVILTNRAEAPTLAEREPRTDTPADHPGEPLPRAEL